MSALVIDELPWRLSGLWDAFPNDRNLLSEKLPFMWPDVESIETVMQ